MPLSCVAFGCTNHNRMTKKPGFYRFPNKDIERRKKWIAACKRKNSDGSPWNPSGKNVYICGEHFIYGKPSKDPNHPDYLPSKFVFVSQIEQKSELKLKRLERATKRANRRQMMSNVASSARKTVVTHLSQSDMVTGENSTKSGEEDTLVNTAEKELEALSTTLTKLESERDQLKDSNASLQVECDSLRSEKMSACQTIQRMKLKFLSFESLKAQPKKFKYYTGISVDIFEVIFDYLKGYLPDNSKAKLSHEDQLLMTLVKLRLNSRWVSLADQFNSNKTSLNNIFWKWIDLIYYKLSFLIKWPDHDAGVQTLPKTFKQYFPRLTGIIDCTEIFIDRPKKLNARACVYSNYKKHSTVKFLIACTPQGSVSFLSKAWGGRISDVELVKESGFMELSHYPGDQILADRGFTLTDEFAAKCGVELVIPSFTKGKNQLSAKEVETTRQIAAIRIHIERVIGLIKNKFAILSSGPLPIPMIKSKQDEESDVMIASIDKIMHACAILTNLGSSIVYNEKDKEQK